MKIQIVGMIGLALAFLSAYVGVTAASVGGGILAGFLLGAAVWCIFIMRHLDNL